MKNFYRFEVKLTISTFVSTHTQVLRRCYTNRHLLNITVCINHYKQRYCDVITVHYTVKPAYSATIGTAEIRHYNRDDTIACKSRLASIFCRVFCEKRMGNYVKQ